jgi:hypothetical protein
MQNAFAGFLGCKYKKEIKKRRQQMLTPPRCKR